MSEDYKIIIAGGILFLIIFNLVNMWIDFPAPLLQMPGF